MLVLVVLVLCVYVCVGYLKRKGRRRRSEVRYGEVEVKGQTVLLAATCDGYWWRRCWIVPDVVVVLLVRRGEGVWRSGVADAVVNTAYFFLLLSTNFC